jgi:rod shape-determining protein MreB
MTGGGCLVYGFDKLIQERTGINVMIAEESVSCVALGTGKALENVDMLMKLDARRKIPKY